MSVLASMKGRQFFYGILITSKVLDDTNRLKKELILFKVDFEKTYDFVD